MQKSFVKGVFFDSLLHIVNLVSATAVPFEEDDKDTSIWFLDHNYHEQMFSMFKKINGKIVAPSHPSLHALCCGIMLASAQ